MFSQAPVVLMMLYQRRESVQQYQAICGIFTDWIVFPHIIIIYLSFHFIDWIGICVDIKGRLMKQLKVNSGQLYS